MTQRQHFSFWLTGQKHPSKAKIRLRNKVSFQHLKPEVRYREVSHRCESSSMSPQSCFTLSRPKHPLEWFYAAVVIFTHLLRQIAHWCCGLRHSIIQEKSPTKKWIIVATGTHLVGRHWYRKPKRWNRTNCNYLLRNTLNTRSTWRCYEIAVWEILLIFIRKDVYHWLVERGLRMFSSWKRRTKYSVLWIIYIYVRLWSKVTKGDSSPSITRVRVVVDLCIYTYIHDVQSLLLIEYWRNPIFTEFWIRILILKNGFLFKVSYPKWDNRH